jgi:hypothetical protein
MYVFAYIAAATMAALGLALLIIPVRSTRVLHDWYIVPPALRPEQRLRVAACRLVGAALVLGGIALAISITNAIFLLF